jgi:NAD(P)-dependent dehydrogenase (short-subunit alcohol dehydrogenase family)
MALASRGAHVVVNDIGVSRDGAGPDGSVAQGVVDEIVADGGSAVASMSSVATKEGAEALISAAVESFGRLDIVINNAGVTGQGAFAEQEVWDRVVGTHLYGTVNVLRAAWPLFESQNYGRVVNTASSSFLGTPRAGDYAAAKGGIIGLSKVLATDSAGSGITINILMPVAYTRMTAAVPDPAYTAWFEKHFAVEKVSAFVLTLCHPTTTVTGETFIAGGGRASRVLFQTTRGHFETDPTPESFMENFASVMEGADAHHATSGQGDLIRYVDLLGDPGPFAPR